MRGTILAFFLIFYTAFSIAQKKVLDYLTYKNWEHIYDQKISNNGAYILYITGSENNGPLLTVQSIDQKWKKILRKARDAVFTKDGQFVIFSTTTDTLGILKLGTDDLQFITGVLSFKTPQEGSGNWLAYLKKSTSYKELRLKNLKTTVEKRYQEVNNYYFNNQGDALVLEKSRGQYSSVIWVNLLSGKTKIIADGGKQYTNFVFGNDSQLAFMADINADNMEGSIMYFRPGMDSAVVQVSAGTAGMTEDVSLSTVPPRFSRDGRRLIFSLAAKGGGKEKKSVDQEIINVGIWNYKDDYLLPQQKKILAQKSQRRFTAVINIGVPGIIRLDREGDNTDVRLGNGGSGSYALVSSGENPWEMYWRKSVRPNIYLLSLKDQSRKLISNKFPGSSIAFNFSASGKYVIWYDQEQRNYFVFNTENGTTKNITQSINVPLFNDENDLPAYPSGFGIAGWLENDEAVLIYDRYDIWQVDPNGLKPSVNITGGYGNAHKVMLRYISAIKNNANNPPVIYKKDKLLLVAFDRVTKQNGFFYKRLGTASYPEKLSMGPYVYFFPSLPSATEAPLSLFIPVKAADTEVYMVQRADASNAPNLYVTKDFRKFSCITDIHPEKDYNWMTTELVHWDMLNGKQAEGILYKPENFDASKKYPVIFTFYEKHADGLNKFIYPELCSGPLNIPYFVSNGYLVFDPNIYYEIGKPGKSVCDAVISGARYISKMPWVDSSRMGMAGHSFGGYEVNYLVTRTSLFKGAVSVAGPSDFVSMYGSIRPPIGASNQLMFDANQCRIGATLWQKPELYIENSPVFFVDKVKTPLLIVSNEGDEAVPWQQGIEYFTGLRRLNKKAWMLQYDGEGHQLVEEKNQLDFSIKLREFFDHYLKDTQPPIWLSEEGQIF